MDSFLKRTFFLIIAAVFGTSLQAQNTTVEPSSKDDKDATMPTLQIDPKVKVGKTLTESGDSIQYVELNSIYIYPPATFKSEKQRRAYNRLVNNVKRVLPIAKQVNVLIIETYEYLQTLPDKKAKDEHLRAVERGIRKQYTPMMKKLTYQQGKLLIKLVYRETDSSSYQLIQAFLGPVRAGVYQAFAALFGASLTKKYDPEGADRLTERVVRMVESGQI